MIKIIQKERVWGFHISEGKNEHFIKIGSLTKFSEITPDKLQQLTFKAKRIEESYISEALRPRVLFSDMLKQNRLKFVTASSGRVRIKLPNAAVRVLRIDRCEMDADAQYIALLVFNHFNFPTNGASFHVAKSLIKSQLYSAL